MCVCVCVCVCVLQSFGHQRDATDYRVRRGAACPPRLAVLLAVAVAGVTQVAKLAFESEGEKGGTGPTASLGCSCWHRPTKPAKAAMAAMEAEIEEGLDGTHPTYLTSTTSPGSSNCCQVVKIRLWQIEGRGK